MIKNLISTLAGRKRIGIYALAILAISILTSYIYSIKAYASPPAGFQTNKILDHTVEGLTALEFAPDGRLFLLERDGTVWIMEDGVLLANPFIELPTTATGDRGLLGIAFDPNFSEEPYVYLYHTSSDLRNRLVKIDASGDVAQGEIEILYQTQEESHELHIGGTVSFGSDGKIYLSIGDNGVPSNAGSLSNPFGKILRLNKDGSVPSDNPFISDPQALDEIWAYGFRNPFRFHIDEETGELFSGEVGDNTWEEINHVKKGRNYGWPTCEGICGLPEYEDPIHQYNHDGGSAAALAGPVYRGSMFPSEYYGNLFYADYAKGFIRRLSLDPHDHEGELHVHVESDDEFDSSVGTVVDMEVAEDGSLYYVTIYPAALYRVSYLADNQAPIVSYSSDIVEGEAPLQISFEGIAYDPEGELVSYHWDFGDGDTSEEEDPQKIYAQKGRYNVTLTVSDGVSQTTINDIWIQVGTPPSVAFVSPVAGTRYSGGDYIQYLLSASDEGGELSESQVSSEIMFHHDDHVHPFLGPFIGKSGGFDIPATGETDTNVWYRINVEAVDDDGLITNEYLDIHPNTVDMTFSTSPEVNGIFLDGSPVYTPLDVTGVVGVEREIAAHAITHIGGVPYIFGAWNDGGNISHRILTPSTDTGYVASYVPMPSFVGEYYNNRELDGEPVLVREDSEIQYNWGIGSPDAVVNSDDFSVRWTNEMYFASGNYIFTTSTDDGVRLYIDGELMIDEWHTQSATSYRTLIGLEEGMHKIRYEYYDATFDAVALLSWELSPDQNILLDKYEAKYWNITDGVFPPIVPEYDPDFDQTTDSVKYNWEDGSIDSSINTDGFIAKWTKREEFLEGNYEVSVLADDGVRIYIDGDLVIDEWKDQSPSLYSNEVYLSRAVHTIEIEYYERGGGAVCEFDIQMIDEAIPPVTGDEGLIATYYSDMDLSGASINRIDRNIDFNWGEEAPIEGINSDGFSISWQGYVTPEFSERYTFSTMSDDGVRLWIGEELLIDKWQDQSPTSWSGEIDMISGTAYPIYMEYYENVGGAVSELNWQSASQDFGRVPDSAFTNDGQTNPPVGGYLGEYWNIDSDPVVVIPDREPDLQRSDKEINFNWHSGSPDSSIDNDDFVARWTKTHSFENGNYRFSVVSDDGVRVYIDGELILDEWIDTSPTLFSVEKDITEGDHEVVVEYYERGGGAVCEFGFEKL